MIYNITNKITMGEFVVSPILMIVADRSTEFTATVVIAGIGIVMAMLLLLILVFYLFGIVVSKMEKNAKIRAEKKAARKALKKSKKAGTQQEDSVAAGSASVQNTSKPAPAPVPQVEEGISGEVVAAIAAAVVATEGSGAVIRSIKKKNVRGRNPWSAAATADNTRPF